jgi:guanylate kinase
MSSKGDGRLIIVSGPTASGKSTLWHHLVAHPQISFSVSATTRAPREGEVDGHDYHYVSDQRFQQMIAQGELLEYAQVHGKYYGTLRREIETAIQAGRDIVLEIDVQGAEQLKHVEWPVVSIFVVPPSLEILRQRLVARNTESAEQMALRLSIVEQEMQHAEHYDHVVVNDDKQAMLAEVEQILGLSRQP